MNLVYGPAHHESFVAQWLEDLSGMRNVIGLIAVGTQIFALSHAHVMLITSFLISYFIIILSL